MFLVTQFLPPKMFSTIRIAAYIIAFWWLILECLHTWLWLSVSSGSVLIIEGFLAESVVEVSSQGRLTGLGQSAAVVMSCRFTPVTGGIRDSPVGPSYTECCWEWLGRFRFLSTSLCIPSWTDFGVIGGLDSFCCCCRKLLTRWRHAAFPRLICSCAPSDFRFSSLEWIRECRCMLPFVVKDMLHTLQINGRSPAKNKYKISKVKTYKANFWHILKLVIRYLIKKATIWYKYLYIETTKIKFNIVIYTLEQFIHSWKI